MLLPRNSHPSRSHSLGAGLGRFATLPHLTALIRLVREPVAGVDHNTAERAKQCVSKPSQAVEKLLWCSTSGPHWAPECRFWAFLVRFRTIYGSGGSFFNRLHPF